MQSFHNELPVSREIVERFRCAVCGKTWEYGQLLKPSRDYLIGAWPSDEGGSWQQCFGVTICNDHKIESTLKIDGREVDEIVNSLAQPHPSIRFKDAKEVA